MCEIQRRQKPNVRRSASSAGEVMDFRSDPQRKALRSRSGLCSAKPRCLAIGPATKRVRPGAAARQGESSHIVALTPACPGRSDIRSSIGSLEPCIGP